MPTFAQLIQNRAAALTFIEAQAADAAIAAYLVSNGTTSYTNPTTSVVSYFYACGINSAGWAVRRTP